MPAEIEAQPVTTSVAVGPDGAFYLSELKGFPAPLGRSQIWRIEPDARNAGVRRDRPDVHRVVAGGFNSSIVDTQLRGRRSAARGRDR
jgi:hypothetical protein